MNKYQASITADRHEHQGMHTFGLGSWHQNTSMLTKTKLNVIINLDPCQEGYKMHLSVDSQVSIILDLVLCLGGQLVPRKCIFLPNLVVTGCSLYLDARLSPFHNGYFLACAVFKYQNLLLSVLSNAFLLKCSGSSPF